MAPRFFGNLFTSDAWIDLGPHLETAVRSAGAQLAHLGVPLPVRNQSVRGPRASCQRPLPRARKVLTSRLKYHGQKCKHFHCSHC
jgi:hypothetical protein